MAGPGNLHCIVEGLGEGDETTQLVFFFQIGLTVPGTLRVGIRQGLTQANAGQQIISSVVFGSGKANVVGGDHPHLGFHGLVVETLDHAPVFGQQTVAELHIQVASEDATK